MLLQKIHALDDTIFIHMKKKDLATIMGKGACSKTTKTLEFSGRQFSLIAEKTYSSMIKLFNCSTLQLNPALFIHPPLVDYFYYKKTKRAKLVKLKKNIAL